MKDLSGRVISQLNTRLEGDEVAKNHVYESFGISGLFPPSKDIYGIGSPSQDIFKLFPDTPVKFLKDVFEALQLYDLVELFPEKPQKARSLRLALPLQEIEKLRKTADGRPTTYHSSAAVLIIADKTKSSAERIKNFFKGLNSKSDVTVIQYRTQDPNKTKMEASAVIDRWIHNQGWLQ